jgi:hypothetical protein
MSIRRVRFLALLVGALRFSVPATGAAVGPDSADYPALSAKQMGHVRHMIDLANRLDGDWSMMGSTPAGENFDAYQFQIAFSAYALAVTHYHYAPAHRDLYRKASARLIKKMIYKDVWDYWAQMSKFEWIGTDENGASLSYTEDDWFGWIDPNIKKNIMYSGHLLQMVGLHEILFDDRSYDEPGSLTFRFAPIRYGQGPIEIKYDHERLAQVIYDQFVEVDFRGIECERNAVYTECNQHPILGLMHYDHKHGTKYAPIVQKGFKKNILERGYVSPKTHTTMYYLDVRKNEVIPATYAWSDGWNGHAHHVWDKPFVEEIYRNQVERYVPAMFKGEPLEDMGWTASFDFGWFALLASEVGDAGTVRAMVDYADEHFRPTWKDGGYYYPYTPDYQESFRRDDEGYIANVSPITGNVLIGFARINPKDGVWQIYNHPWDASHSAEPFITDVEYLEASVAQAVYDAEKSALVVTLAPGPVKSETTSFLVRQLDPLKSYLLIRDGEVLGEISGSRGIVLPGTEWQGDDTLRITTPLRKPHSFVLLAQPVSAAAH